MEQAAPFGQIMEVLIFRRRIFGQLP